ncbi:MAG: transcriptional regulator, partial [Candidatus Parabeggiatoa sp. nov. 3]
MNIGGRLKKAILLKNKSLKDFSKTSEIPYITLQQYLAGKREPAASVLTKINIHSNISIDWLLTGRGTMYNDVPIPKVKEKTVNEIDEHLKTLRPAQREEIFGRTLEMVRMNEMEEKLERLLKER